MVDAPIHVSDDGHEYYKLPLYYAMGHFSKFLIPDSVRIEHRLNQDNVGQNVELVVFERPDHSIVLTVLNKNNHKVSLKVHDPKHGFVTMDIAPDSMDSIIWN